MTIIDKRACTKCLALNGQEIEGNPFNPTLNHPIFGPIWDFSTDQPLTHGGTPHNCRCQIQAYATVHWSEIEPINSLALNYKIQSEDEVIELPGTIAEIRAAISNLGTEIEGMKWNYHELREGETVFRRFLFLLEQSTGSQDIRNGIDLIQRLTSTIRVAQFAWVAFETATGPLGWLLALSGAIMAGSYVYSLGTELNMTRPTYSG
jgi:hypothetical protein